MALLLVSGCRPAAVIDPPEAAHPAAGVQIAFDYLGDDGHPWEIQGELLAIEDDGLLLVAHPSVAESGAGARPTVTSIGFDGVRHLRIEGLQGTVTFPLTDADRRALARRARYPSGIDAVLVSRLLEVYDQDELVVLP